MRHATAPRAQQVEGRPIGSGGPCQPQFGNALPEIVRRLRQARLRRCRTASRASRPRCRIAPSAAAWCFAAREARRRCTAGRRGRHLHTPRRNRRARRRGARRCLRAGADGCRGRPRRGIPTAGRAQPSAHRCASTRRRSPSLPGRRTPRSHRESRSRVASAQSPASAAAGVMAARTRMPASSSGCTAASHRRRRGGRHDDRPAPIARAGPAGAMSAQAPRVGTPAPSSDAERFPAHGFVRSQRHLHLVMLAGRAPDHDRRSLASKRCERRAGVRSQRRPDAERAHDAFAGRLSPDPAVVCHFNDAAGRRRQFDADSSAHTTPAVYVGSCRFGR